MAINVAKVQEGSYYAFEEDITLSEDLLAGRLAVFESPCKVKGEYVMDFDSNVYVTGELEIDVTYKCDLCLKSVSSILKADFSASYSLADDNEHDYRYTNNTVDVTQAVSEAVVLNIPTKVLCKSECKGICPSCGIDLNEGSCDCFKEQEAVESMVNHPFSVLKDLNKFTGGASNGST